MVKKFGKILLFVSTIGAAFAGAYYFMKSRKDPSTEEDEYEDLDDDSYELPEDEDANERSYVPLHPDEKAENAKEETVASEKESSGTAGHSDSTVEEEKYYDDDDSDDGDSSLNAM